MAAARWLSLIALLLVVAQASQDLFLAGGFVSSIVQDNGSLRHAAGILAYDPENDEYVDKFSGGVFVDVGTITLLQDTLFGIIGAGYFRFVDDDFGYSSGVLFYDGDEDDYQGLNDGIWLGQGDSVRYIASIDDYAVFAGTFKTVESLSIKNFNDDDNDVVVPNIVKMDSDETYSLLEDPQNIFPNGPGDSIQGLVATNNGNTLYVYSVNHGIYSWDKDDYYQLAFAVTNITHDTLTIDSQNNLYGISRVTTVQGTGGTSTTSTYYLAVLNTNDKSQNYYEIISLDSNYCTSSTFKLLAWNGGILVTYPESSTGCTSTTFAYFNTTTSTLVTPNFPDGSFEIQSIVNGNDNDLWVIPAGTESSGNANLDYLYYYKSEASSWAQVSIAPVHKFHAYSMVWDSKHDELLVFLNDLTQGFSQKLVKIAGNFNPPSGCTVLNPGKIGNAGTVHGVASIQDEDDEDYEIYLGGIFNYVGDGIPAQNLVKFSKGDWHAVNSPPVKTLASYGSTLYIGYLEPSGNNVALPISVLNTQGQNTIDSWSDLPVVIGGGGSVSAIYSDDEEVFVGGDFTVRLPGSQDTANGVVVYNKKNKTWGSIGIPNTIGSPGDTYTINSFNVNNVSGSSILAIGGYFTFTVGSLSYNSLAFYNLDTNSWIPTTTNFNVNTQISEVLLNNTGVAYLAGSFDIPLQTNVFGVASYLMNSSALTEIGDLEDYVDGIAIYTDDKQREYIYAAGFLDAIPGVNGTYGLAYAQLSGTTQTWIPAGTSTLLYNCFFGSVTHLIYQTGGQGANGNNGLDSSYSSAGVDGSNGGGKGWWITLIVLAVLFVVIVIPVGAFVGWKYFGRKRNYYEEL